MAHANPEFALGLMRHEPGPVSHQLPPPASLATLRLRMAELPADDPRRALYERTVRQQRHQFARERQIRDALAEPVGGMHAGAKGGERFTEPKRRYPADVQAGREKPRRGTLPR
ncbi:hypothetical protein [Methylorubrum suomiense]|uniref:Uncharacterized protein n=1 Tax=Methylorubrum suomiense TaxID=144191 RepID=A0ABQ4V195_9HYPH|nr:hypothetical protein [Methylorubrum suomiense]GJE78065.1 hypothetical protein BGCPKDLD_4676 [Methylorubrum suomiense]